MDKIHHIAIQVKDIDETLKWYQQQFNCEVAYHDKTWALITFENISLALVTAGQHPPHFAIERADAADFGELTPHRDGTSSIYIKDPTGNDVEVIKLK